jgi:hypothetical protein
MTKQKEATVKRRMNKRTFHEFMGAIDTFMFLAENMYDAKVIDSKEFNYLLELCELFQDIYKRVPKTQRELFNEKERQGSIQA